MRESLAYQSEPWYPVTPVRTKNYFIYTRRKSP